MENLREWKNAHKGQNNVAKTCREGKTQTKRLKKKPVYNGESGDGGKQIGLTNVKRDW